MTIAPSDDDLRFATDWRHRVHRRPELSGRESATASAVVDALGDGPDEIVTGLGGTGVAAVFAGPTPGPTVLLRAELDALPIPEETSVPHRSQVDGCAHLCGHDGHMAVLVAVGRALRDHRPASGRVVLLFQPAEETGAGAAAVLADPAFGPCTPDLAFAFHNLPGRALGHAALAAGPVHCASRGMRLVLRGSTAHASEPWAARSPGTAVADLVTGLPALGRRPDPGGPVRMVTVTHAELGEATFGVAPGRAEVWATLRTTTDDEMDGLVAEAEASARSAAAEADVDLEIEFRDVFRHCENHPVAVEHLARAFDAEGITHDETGLPMLASEDFGLFGDVAPAAMVLVGAGEDHPPLHSPGYDFPDALVGPMARAFLRLVDQAVG